MPDGTTARSQRLRDKLADNARRLRRREAAAAASAHAAVTASACDRFSLHCCDARHDALKRRMSQATARPPDATSACDRRDRGASLHELLVRHGLGGWCLVFAGFGSAGAEIALGVGASDVAALVAALTDEFPGAFDDTWIACEAQRWSLLIHHEGEASLWRDI